MSTLPQPVSGTSEGKMKCYGLVNGQRGCSAGSGVLPWIFLIANPYFWALFIVFRAVLKLLPIRLTTININCVTFYVMDELCIYGAREHKEDA